jgi:hypothetical protein
MYDGEDAENKVIKMFFIRLRGSLLNVKTVSGNRQYGMVFVHIVLGALSRDSSRIFVTLSLIRRRKPRRLCNMRIEELVIEGTAFISQGRHGFSNLTRQMDASRLN